MLLTTTVTTKWNPKTKKYYESLGYKYTGLGTELVIKTEHLKPYSRQKVEVQCDYCGKKFIVDYADYFHQMNDTKIKKICCKDCYEAKAQETIEVKYGVKNIGELASTKTIREKIKKTNLEKYGVENVFANVDIQNKIKNTLLEKYGVEHISYSKEIIEKIKSVCMEKYGVPYYLALNYSGDKIRGANSPTWKGGVKTERPDIHSWEYKSWRKSVFDRDLYTCQKCGKKQGKSIGTVVLNAHHIYNYKDYPDKRLDIDNGVTLCKECHIKFHSIFGKKNNTLQQFLEFLQMNFK